MMASLRVPTLIWPGMVVHPLQRAPAVLHNLTANPATPRPMEPPQITLIEILVPPGSQGIAGYGLLVLRLFMGVAFIRHGWPKLRNLRTWATAMKTPEWLCFLSAASMFGGGIALLPGLLTPLAALAILVSMAYAVVLEISSGFPFIAPDPYQIPPNDYVGPMGMGEPPSWEKAAMYCVMALVLITCGGGALSLDTLLIEDLLRTLL
jgi:putative oxidoreductase